MALVLCGCDMYKLFGPTVAVMTQVDTSPVSPNEVKVKYETLRAMEQADSLEIDAHISHDRVSIDCFFV